MGELAPPDLDRSSGTPGSKREMLEQKIARRAKDFDLGALVTLLRAELPELPLRFRSHPAMSPGPTAVRDIEFRSDAVIVTLNLGLFSSTTPLPSYFYEWLSGPNPVRGLEAILSVLDD